MRGMPWLEGLPLDVSEQYDFGVGL